MPRNYSALKRRRFIVTATHVPPPPPRVDGNRGVLGGKCCPSPSLICQDVTTSGVPTISRTRKCSTFTSLAEIYSGIARFSSNMTNQFHITDREDKRFVALDWCLRPFNKQAVKLYRSEVTDFRSRNAVSRIESTSRLWPSIVVIILIQHGGRDVIVTSSWRQTPLITWLGPLRHRSWLRGLWRRPARDGIAA